MSDGDKPITVHQLPRYERRADRDELKTIDALIADAGLCGCEAHQDTIDVLRRYRAILVRQHTMPSRGKAAK